MTTQDLIIIGVAIPIAALTLVGAWAAWRTLGRAGRGLRAASDDLSTRAQKLPAQLSGVRAELAVVDAQVEHALWMLGELDDRIDRASADMRAKRVTSDSLRVRLINGRLTVARIRQLMRLVVRLGELRRAFL
jgi:hypothetical protein